MSVVKTLCLVCEGKEREKNSDTEKREKEKGVSIHCLSLQATHES